MNKRALGFTLVELLIVVVVIGILASISVVYYSGVQKRAAAVTMQSDLKEAADAMQTQRAMTHAYPSAVPSDLKTSPKVHLTLSSPGSTNVYSGLTAAQNAELFAQICNSLMPMKSPDGSLTYTATCIRKWGMELSGGVRGNYLNTPIADSFSLSGCPSCTDSYYMPYNTVAAAITSELKNQFLTSGGTFPVVMETQESDTITLPAPSSTIAGTGFCIQATYSGYSDLIMHVTDQTGEVAVYGGCT